MQQRAWNLRTLYHTQVNKSKTKQVPGGFGNELVFGCIAVAAVLE